MQAAINARVIQSNTSFYCKIHTYIPSKQHVSATRSHHQAFNIRTDPSLVFFGVRVGSQLLHCWGVVVLQYSKFS